MSTDGIDQDEGWQTLRITWRTWYRPDGKLVQAELESPLTGEVHVAYADSTDEACNLVMLALWREYDQQGHELERRDTTNV